MRTVIDIHERAEYIHKNIKCNRKNKEAKSKYNEISIQKYEYMKIMHSKRPRQRSERLVYIM